MRTNKNNCKECMRCRTEGENIIGRPPVKWINLVDESWGELAGSAEIKIIGDACHGHPLSSHERTGH